MNTPWLLRRWGYKVVNFERVTESVLSHQMSNLDRLLPFL